MLLSTVCLSTVCAVGCQSALVIRPSGSEFTKAVGTSMLLTCEDSAATPGSRLVWKDNRNRDVTVHSQQGYVSQSPLCQLLRQGILKEILELHKGVWGKEVPQRGPGAEPQKLKHIVVYCNKF